MSTANLNGRLATNTNDLPDVYVTRMRVLDDGLRLKGYTVNIYPTGAPHNMISCVIAVRDSLDKALIPKGSYGIGQMVRMAVFANGSRNLYFLHRSRVDVMMKQNCGMGPLPYCDFRHATGVKALTYDDYINLSQNDVNMDEETVKGFMAEAAEFGFSADKKTVKRPRSSVSVSALKSKNVDPSIPDQNESGRESANDSDGVIDMSTADLDDD